MDATTDPVPVESTEPRWRVIVGVLGLVYGIFGVLAHSFAILSSLFFSTLMSMSGLKVEMPPAMKLATYLQSGPLIVLGLILVAGSSFLLARRRKGASLMRFWAIARLVMLVVQLGVSIATIPIQVDFTMAMNEATRDMVRERGGDPSQVETIDRDAAAARSRYMAVGFVVIAAAFPLFVGLLLSNRRKRDEIANWQP